jgi:hypothetical protein
VGDYTSLGWQACLHQALVVAQHYEPGQPQAALSPKSFFFFAQFEGQIAQSPSASSLP